MFKINSCTGANDASYDQYPFKIGKTYRVLGANETAKNRFRVFSDRNSSCVNGTLATLDMSKKKNERRKTKKKKKELIKQTNNQM